jgi:methyl-accepting chemotaxis protein
MNRMADMNDRTKTITEVAAAERATALKFADDFGMYRSDTLRLVLVSTPDDESKLKADMARQTADLQQDIEVYGKLATQSDDRANLEKLKASWATIRAAEDGFIQSAVAVDDNASNPATMLASQRHLHKCAVIQNETLAPDIEAMTATIDSMVEWNTTRSSDLAASAAASYATARTAMITLLALSLVVGVGLAFLITTSTTGAINAVVERLRSLDGICLTRMREAISALANGDFSKTPESGTSKLQMTRKDEFGELSGTLDNMIGQTQDMMDAFRSAQAALKELVAQANSAAQSLSESSENLAAGMGALANGDLTVQLPPRKPRVILASKGEFATLATSFTRIYDGSEVIEEAFVSARGSLSALIGQTRIASETITTTAAEIASGNEDLSHRTSEQASSLEETAASMEEMTSIVRQSADNAREANKLSSQARRVADDGGQIVGSAVESMMQINAASRKINDIIGVIDEIAFQTNLLALNAAVEAARVGEQGRGFAVVASEVRNLAGRSSTAAKEIKTLVQDTVRKVEDGTQLVNKSGEQLKEIVDAVNRVADIVSDITSAAQEQASGIEQVNKAVMQMDEITQQNAALVEEASAASQSMAARATELQTLVSRFKVDEALLDDAKAQTAPPPPASARPRVTGTYGSTRSVLSVKRAPLALVAHPEQSDVMEEF